MFGWLKNNTQRWQRWVKLFTSFAAAQLIVQLLNTVAGFLLIRSLDKPQYAWFTIATGMTTALNVLADAGISSALTTQGGQIWRDQKKFSCLVQAALRLRAKMAFIASLVIGPLCVWLLIKNDSPTKEAWLIACLVLVPVWQISTASIFTVVNRLHAKTKELQIADITLAFSRAALTILLVFTGLITPTLAIVATVLSQALQYAYIRSKVQTLLDLERPQLNQINEAIGSIKKQVKLLYPNAVFTCIQGQLSTWLFSFFGSNHEIADFGALNRFAIIFTITSAPIQQWITPVFAKESTHKKQIFTILAAVTSVIVISTICIAITYFFPQLPLSLLGQKYSHLKEELLWMFAIMSSNSIMQTIWGLNIARGWVKSLSWNMPLVLLVQLAMFPLVNLSTIQGVAQLSVVVAIAQCVHATLVMSNGLRQNH